MAAAQYVQVPGYSALILRKSFPELEQAGGFIPLSKEWWSGKADWNARSYTWTFPSGATIRFGHIDHDDGVEQYAGGAYQFICYDEVTWHTEFRYTFMFSRFTKMTTGPLARVPVRMRATANPNGKHSQWVKKRFVDPKTRKATAIFIPALVQDNPSVDASQVEESLGHTSELTRKQLLYGNWDAVESGQFKKEWFRWYRRDDNGFVVTEYGERFLPEMQQRWQTVDPAAGLSADADNSVIATWCLSPKGNLIWLDCIIGKFEILDLVDECQRAYKKWKPQFMTVEEVLSQKALAQILRRSLNPAMVIRSVNPRGQDKATRAVPAFFLASTGRLLFPEDNRNFPLDQIEGELLSFTGEKGGSDDTVDVLSYSVQVMSEVSQFFGGGANAKFVPTFYDPSATKMLGG